MKTVKLAILYAEIIMIAFMIVIQIIPGPMLRLFNASDDMLAIGIPALRTISISFIFAGYCIISSSFFQALGSSVYSMIVSIVRQLVFLVPLAFLFSKTGNVDMVWWAWPLAELASVAVCTVFQHIVKKKKFNYSVSDKKANDSERNCL